MAAARAAALANLEPGLRGSLHRHPRRWRIAWYSVAAAVIVLLGTILVWPRQPTAAERRVQDFLAAIQRGDVSAARHMVAGQPDTEETDTSFLRADVLKHGGWHVVSVRAADDADDHPFSADVDATVSVPGGRTVSYRFAVSRQSTDDDWQLQDPYVYLNFGAFPLPYVAINGHREALPHANGSTTHGGWYVLLPGMYRFFSSASGVRHSTSAHSLAPGRYVVRQDGDESAAAPNTVTLPRMTLSESAQRKAQQAVYDYLDGCAKRAKLVTTGCPFGAEYVPEPGRPDRIFYGDEVKSVRWKVQRRPVITIQPVGDEFRVLDRRPGVMKLTATGTDEDTGFHATTSMSCPTRDGILRVDITDSGGFRVYPNGGRYDEKHVDHSPIRWRTC